MILPSTTDAGQRQWRDRQPPSKRLVSDGPLHGPPRSLWYGDRVALPPHPIPIVRNVVDSCGLIGNKRNIISVLGGGNCSIAERECPPWS